MPVAGDGLSLSSLLLKRHQASFGWLIFHHGFVLHLVMEYCYACAILHSASQLTTVRQRK